jgi:FAD/FMN-containing dehydrogenase
MLLISLSGDGNIHAVVMIRADDPNEVSLARELSAKMALHAISLGGTCTGEHGIGSGKIELLKTEMVYLLFKYIYLYALKLRRLF